MPPFSGLFQQYRPTADEHFGRKAPAKRSLGSLAQHAICGASARSIRPTHVELGLAAFGLILERKRIPSWDANPISMVSKRLRRLSSAGVQAARDGYGVALSDEIISARDLDEGRLVQPLQLAVPAINNYYCICTEANRERQDISYFIDWLLTEATNAGRGYPSDV